MILSFQCQVNGCVIISQNVGAILIGQKLSKLMISGDWVWVRKNPQRDIHVM